MAPIIQREDIACVPDLDQTFDASFGRSFHIWITRCSP